MRRRGVPGGGWADSDDEGQGEEQLSVGNQQNTGGSFKPYPKYGGKASQPGSFQQNSGNQSKYGKKKVDETVLIELKALATKQYEYEMRLINQIIQPHGVRMKPPQDELSKFCVSAQTLGTNVVGSALLHKLQQNYKWVVKAVTLFPSSPQFFQKTLYVIQELIKVSQKYKQFFEKNSQLLENMRIPQEGSNQVQNLQKQTLSMLNEDGQGNQNQGGLQLTVNFGDDLFGNSKSNGNTNQETQPDQGGEADLLGGDDDGMDNQSGNLMDLMGDQPQQPQKPTSFGFIKQAQPQQTTNSFDFIKKPQQPQQQQQTQNAFDFMKQNQNQQNSQQKQQNNAFGFLKTGGGSQQQQQGGMDLLSMGQPQQQQPQQQQPQHQKKQNSFGFIQPSNQQQKSQQNNQQSGFNFLNQQQQNQPQQSNPQNSNSGLNVSNNQQNQNQQNQQGNSGFNFLNQQQNQNQQNQRNAQQPQPQLLNLYGNQNQMGQNQNQMRPMQSMPPQQNMGYNQFQGQYNNNRMGQQFYQNQPQQQYGQQNYQQQQYNPGFNNQQQQRMPPRQQQGFNQPGQFQQNRQQPMQQFNQGGFGQPPQQVEFQQKVEKTTKEQQLDKAFDFLDL